MSTLVKNIILSALHSERLNIIVLNIAHESEVADFDFNIYSLDKIVSNNIMNIDDKIFQRNRCIYFDAIINLRPFNNNLDKIIAFQQSWQLPIINYIVDVNDKLTKEMRMRRSEAIQKMNNFISAKDLASQIYLPKAKILSPKEFSDYMKEHN